MLSSALGMFSLRVPGIDEQQEVWHVSQHSWEIIEVAGTNNYAELKP